MAVDLSHSPSHTTTAHEPDAAERWRLWEQRGRDNDALLTRRTRAVLAVFAVAGSASLIAALWFS